MYGRRLEYYVLLYLSPTSVGKRIRVLGGNHHARWERPPQQAADQQDAPRQFRPVRLAAAGTVPGTATRQRRRRRLRPVDRGRDLRPRPAEHFPRRLEEESQEEGRRQPLTQ